MQQNRIDAFYEESHSFTWFMDGIADAVVGLHRLTGMYKNRFSKPFYFINYAFWVKASKFLMMHYFH